MSYVTHLRTAAGSKVQRHLAHLLVAVSLANLCYVEVWGVLFDPEFQFLRKEPLSSLHFVVAAFNVLFLTAVLWVLVTAARGGSSGITRRLAHGALLLAFLLALNGILRVVFGFLLPLLGGSALVVMRLVLLASLALVFVWWRRGDMKPVIVFSLILFPFVFITFAHAGWLSFNPRGREAFRDKPLAPALAFRDKPASRVVWFVFDEMTERVAFSQRPPTVALPELDRLRSQALSAGNAYPPSNSSMLSMPSLIMGKLVSASSPTRPDELMITLAGGNERVGWSTQPNVFSRAREAGFNTAVVGWYLPYCPVIGGSLSVCHWEPYELMDDQKMRLSDFIAGQIVFLMRAVPGARRIGLTQRMITRGLEKKKREKHLSAYLRILEQAKKVVANPDLDLVLVHWPIPHSPGIYSRVKDDLALTSESNYLDNYELADRTLGEMRQALERAGLWESTAVLVTADHGWAFEYWTGRPLWTDEEAKLAYGEYHRVPFVLRLAGQTEGFPYQPAFNTILTPGLLLPVLRGDVTTPQGAAEWIDQHGSMDGIDYPSRDR